MRQPQPKTPRWRGADGRDGQAPWEERAAASSGPAGAPISGLLIPAGAITVGISTVLAQPRFPLLSVLLGLGVGAMALVANSPAWALAPALITELSFADILPGMPVSARLAAVALALPVMAWVILVRRPSLRGPAFHLVLWPSVAFIVGATLGNASSGGDYMLQYLRFQTVQLLTMLLVAFLIVDRPGLKKILLFALAVGLFVAFACIVQHSWPRMAPYGGGTAESVLPTGRAIGLTRLPTSAANDLTFVLMPVLGVIACRPKFFDRLRWSLAGPGLMLLVGAYYTYTRSAMLAVACGILMLVPFAPRLVQVLILTGMVAGAAIYPNLEGTGVISERYYTPIEKDRSASSHLALWQVGFAMATSRPFDGIGHDRFEQESTNYMSAIEGEQASQKGASAVGQDRPHNDFLSIWISWGFLALLSYLAIFGGAALNCVLIAVKTNDWLIRGLAAGCFAGLARFGADSMFHNYMDNSTYLWMYVGLSVALARLAAQAPAPAAAPAPSWGPVESSRTRGRPNAHGALPRQ